MEPNPIPRGGIAAARSVGVLLILQMAGLIVPYVMLHPISRSNWLKDAAAAGGSIRIALVGLLLTCGVAIAISLLVRRFIGRRTSIWADILIGASALMLVLQSIDVLYLLRMLAMSEEHARGLSTTFASELAASRRTAHYAGLASIDAWMFFFYGLLFYTRLVPRSIAGFGFITVALHFFGLLLPMILGGQGVTALGAMMALGHLI
ncbi:MAG: hypothetical protein H7Y17_07065 [Chlorobia bacterium]|nr:hypothetical protein [Fimbriimonadaceae bacterium]